MIEPTDEKPIELEHRVAKVDACTFVIPKECETPNCRRRATRAIVFTSDDEALPTKAKFLCRGHLKKMVDELSRTAYPKGEN